MLRSIRDRSPLRRYYMGYQAAGILATAWTAVKLGGYILRLMTRPLEFHHGPPTAGTVRVKYSPDAFPRFASTLLTLRQGDGCDRPTGAEHGDASQERSKQAAADRMTW